MKHYDKEHRIPYTVRTIKRAGKYRRCALQFNRMPSGQVMDCGRIIAMSV